MAFVQFCVGAVIFIIILVATGGIGALFSGDLFKEEWAYSAWVMSALGFASCLTILLYQNGIIK